MICPACPAPVDAGAERSSAPTGPAPDGFAAYRPGERLSLEAWISQGWRSFKARPGSFVLWALVLMIPGLALEIFRWSQGTLLRPMSPNDLPLLLGTTVLSVAFAIALLPLHLGGNLVALALQRGHRPAAMKFLQAYGRGLPLVACYILFGLCCGLVFILLVLPSGFIASGGLLTRVLVGIYMVIAVPFSVWVYAYLGIGWMFAPLMVVERGMGPLDAMRASWHLVAGHRWRMLGFLLVLMLVSLLGILACLVGTLITHGLVAGAFAAAYRDLLAQAAYPDTELE
jgi:hypothetical protein